MMSKGLWVRQGGQVDEAAVLEELREIEVMPGGLLNAKRKHVSESSGRCAARDQLGRR